MNPSQKTNHNNHTYFYQAIESNKVNIEWLTNEIHSIHTKMDKLLFLSLSTLISLLIFFASFVLNHIKIF